MLLDWVAAGKRWVKFRVFSKPVSLLILIYIFISFGGWQNPGIWFLGGLIFSLLGDIFLLMRSRFFIAGLVSFLVAHIFYIIGLGLGALNWSVWMLVPVAIISLLIILAYPRIIGGIRRSLEHRHLWLPVLLYMVTITLMLLLAMLTWFRESWVYPSALLASVGALLFTISDTVLATGRFLRPVPYGNFLVMFTYHLGQLGIAFGALSMMGLI